MQSVIEWTDWHLTPQGWHPGTTKIAATEYSIDAPQDRVLTYRYSESRAAGSSIISRSRLIWTTVAAHDIDALVTRFGLAPQEVHVVRVEIIRNRPPPNRWTKTA